MINDIDEDDDWLFKDHGSLKHDLIESGHEIPELYTLNDDSLADKYLRTIYEYFEFSEHLYDINAESKILTNDYLRFVDNDL